MPIFDLHFTRTLIVARNDQKARVSFRSATANTSNVVCNTKHLTTFLRRPSATSSIGREIHCDVFENKFVFFIRLHMGRIGVCVCVCGCRSFSPLRTKNITSAAAVVLPMAYEKKRCGGGGREMWVIRGRRNKFKEGSSGQR